MQIIVGQRGKRVTTTDSSSLSPAISSDAIVAVYLEKYSDEIPQIGKVCKLDDDNVEIEWYTGCYSGNLVCVCVCVYVCVCTFMLQIVILE